MQTSAFTAVTVRQAFSRSERNTERMDNHATSTSVVQEPPPPKTQKMNWPSSVRFYVQRSFAEENQIDGVSAEEMEKRLKEVITAAAETNSLNDKPWDTMPLPQQLIQAERKQTLVERTHQQPWNQKFQNMVISKELTAQPSPSRKRKSSDAITSFGEHEAEQNVPPWRKASKHRTLEDRTISKMSSDKRQRIHGLEITSKFNSDLEKRRKRFQDNPYQSSHGSGFSRDGTPSSDGDTGPVVGRCQKLEKQYFRLTSAPNPETVRPLSVLKKSLQFLIGKWKEEQNYSYICDQFKSLRQDLTVQHIKNEFTVKVYELHAKIALEKGDLGEYNQCQTQLRSLYSENLGGRPTEFKAYRILYFIHTQNRTEMNDVLADLTPADKSDPAVRHALDVRSALALGNYHQFFGLYLSTPNLGAYLIDRFVDRERLAALAIICRAYKPDVRLRFITEELAFNSDQQALEFLQNHGAEGFLVQREDEVFFTTGRSGALFEKAKAAAFQRVDIKGQI